LSSNSKVKKDRLDRVENAIYFKDRKYLNMIKKILKEKTVALNSKIEESRIKDQGFRN